MRRLKAFYAWMKTPEGQRVLRAVGEAAKAFWFYLRRDKDDA